MTTIPASHHDLLQSPVATFATIGPDGRPQLSEVWFLADDDSVAISLNTTRQKTKNILERPACCLFILDLADPQRYLEIRGDAEVSADVDGVFVNRVSEKYGVNPRSYDQPGDERVVVRIVPQRVNAVNMGG
jgi:PPOX class probable F420-dependent enzyme